MILITKERRTMNGIMFKSGQEGMGLMDKWRGGSRRECKQFFHFNRRKERNILTKMQVSGWKLEEVLPQFLFSQGNRTPSKHLRRRRKEEVLDV